MTGTTRSSRRRPDDAPCQNCGDPTPGQYCPHCGQRKVEVRASLGTVFGDVLQDEFVLNAALPRTVVALLFRPGLLTYEYVRGRIARYIPPLRLYLVASVVFFLVISFIGLRALDRATFGGGVSFTAESARTALSERLAQLEQVDTVNMPVPVRAIMRQTRLATDSALQAIAGAAPTDTVIIDATLIAGAGGVTLPPGTMQQWAQNFGYPSSHAWVKRGIDRKIQQIGHLPPRDAVRTVLSDMLAYAPHMVFVLLPVFALLLKLLYIRRDRYYMEHFVFALHAHAFFFVMFLIIVLVPWSRATQIIVVWMMIYVWLAMKRVYGQGWFRTTVKWWVLGWSYMFVFLFGLIGLTFVALLFA